MNLAPRHWALTQPLSHLVADAKVHTKAAVNMQHALLCSYRIFNTESDVHASISSSDDDRTGWEIRHLNKHLYWGPIGDILIDELYYSCVIGLCLIKTINWCLCGAVYGTHSVKRWGMS